MKEIPLTQGKITIVDDGDYERLNQFKWCVMNGRGYWRAARHIQEINGKRKNEYMARYILDAPSDMDVDHINGKTLDNRKENLRLCTESINTQNQHISRGSSNYQGVHWNKRAKKWCARITKNQIRYHLGYFRTEIDAACAYNKAALKLYQNPKLNKI